MSRVICLHLPFSGSAHGSSEERNSVRAIARALDERLNDGAGGAVDGHEFGGGEALVFVFALSFAEVLEATRSCIAETTGCWPGAELVDVGDGPPVQLESGQAE